MPRDRIIAEEIPQVDGIVFIAPNAKGGWLVYAWVGQGWRPYDYAEDKQDALRRARKASFRLKNVGVIFDGGNPQPVPRDDAG